MNQYSFEKPELLTPVQNWRTLKYVDDIADAIYFGIEDYNMRGKAKNFKRADLEKIVEFCHSKEPPIKTYLCTNILVYNNELTDLKTLINTAKDLSVDAIIAHDLAAINYARKININFHVSTQANISNIESAKFYERLGAVRLILARELSLKQIKKIKKDLESSEIEVFIHGSMCTSISGRCYFSASVENSAKYSANRGNCMHPCRRTWTVIDDQNNQFIYNGQLFLNSKDLCMIEYIPELIETNIDSLKIEGRMKDPMYVRTVSECYKEAIESYYEDTYSREKINNWLKRLTQVFNRGFHTGFYFETPDITNIQLNKRGNQSNYKKEYIGIVDNYNKATKTTDIAIENNNIEIHEGDIIIFSGNDTYNLDKIKDLMVKGKKLMSVNIKDSSNLSKINIRVKKEVNEKDKVYLFSINH